MITRTAPICVLALTAVAVLVASPTPDPAQNASKMKTAPHKTVVRKQVSTRPIPHAASTAVTQTSTGHKPTTKTISTRKRSVAAAKPAPVTWRSRQLAPAPERNREIQQALVAKGYLRPEQATGAWDDSSADALRRFQTDQNITVSGKINSLSLIALGLGPKHDSAEAPKPEPSADGRQ